jgi:hypothetical protein
MLSWQTPHRIALAIDIMVQKIEEADSDPVFINKCEAFNDDGGRRIHLSLFNGKVWSIRFPDRDIMLPQPPPPPNLDVTVKKVVQLGGQNTGDSKHPPSSSPSPSPSPSATPSPSPTQTSSPTPGVNASPVAEYIMPWTITPKLTYFMNAEFFQPDGNSTPGIPGLCRYRFSDPGSSLKGGIIECQNAPGFAYILIPLACSGAFVSTEPLPR